MIIKVLFTKNPPQQSLEQDSQFIKCEDPADRNERRIQDFPKGRQPERGALVYYFGKFRRKLHENEENWTGVRTRPKF